MKSQELKETLQLLSTANIELENTQKQVLEFKKALEEKNSSLKKAHDERDAAEKAKVLFDTEIKVGSSMVDFNYLVIFDNIDNIDNEI